MKSVYTVKTIISKKARVIHGIIGILVLFFFPSVQILAQCPGTTIITAPPVCQGQPILLNISNPLLTGSFDATINGEVYTGITQGTPFPAKGLRDNFFGTTIPAPSVADPTRNELGMRFKAAEDGFIIGVRFYKDAAATGPFTGSLWTSAGVQLATGTFPPVLPGVSGWQLLVFDAPVAITADVIYTVSYYSPNGNYSFDAAGFDTPLTSIDGFMTAPADDDIVDGPNGVYKSGSSGFPSLNYLASNYFVDVIFQPEAVPTGFDLTDLASVSIPCTQTGAPISSAPLVVNPIPAGTITAPGIGVAGQPATINFNSTVGTAPFTVVVNGSPYTTPNPISTAVIPSTTTTRIWNSASLPTPTVGGGGPIEVGMKFRTSAPGLVTALRFYRSVATSATTILNLWDASGGNLATVAFADGGVASGFIDVDIPTDIQLLTNTTYVVSYYNASGEYNYTNGFTATDFTNGPITVPANGGIAGDNGVFLLAAGGGFPTTPSGALNNNYWADVVFQHATTQWPLTLTEINDANGCGVFVNQSITIQVSNPLPVTYTEFRASVENANNVKLDWATASESNNRGFDVERSADAAKWLNLGFVPGNGTSSLQNKYSFVDRGVPTGKFFYRLKQVDLDGKFKFSNILTVDINGKLAFELNQNFPNPSKGLSTITYSVPVKSNVTIKVYDMNGRVVKVLQNGERAAGRYSLTVPSDLLKSGVYYYKMEAAGFMATRKMIVQ